MTIDQIRRLDAGGMYDALKHFPEQWREGRRLALQADLSEVRLNGYHNVLVAGMGGSAIGGDLLRTLSLSSAPVPVAVSRSYTLPAWVGADTLVVASSYSGNTEETLASLKEAEQREASIVCLATGGQVLDRAQRAGHPFVRLPGGLQPRAALGYSLTALLTLAERAGLLGQDRERWDETQALLDRQAAALADPSGNEALDLAERLEGTLPLVYSSEGLLEAVNLRWRNQIHENSKTPAAGNLFPELNHNEIMGWERRTPLLDPLAVVVLRDRGDHDRVRRRIDVTRELLDGRVRRWIEVESRGTSALARVMSLVNLGDWVSFYLAALQGTDPTPIGLINRLKASLQA